VVVRASNLISEMENIAEIWIQNPFYLDKTKFLSPALNPAIKTNKTAETGEGNFQIILY